MQDSENFQKNKKILKQMLTIANQAGCRFLPNKPKKRYKNEHFKLRYKKRK